MFKRILNVAVILLLGFTQNVIAQDSGFLSDYTGFEANTDMGVDSVKTYLHPDVFTALSKYQAIMIDQPELIMAADSKVKSMKPDDMVQVAEGMRISLSNQLAVNYFIVDKPGPEVLLLRTAASNLYIKKAKRGLLSYTPIGAVAHAAKQASTDNIAKKMSLVEVTIEGEILDSMSGERLAAFVTQRGQRKDKKKNQKLEPSSWDELMGLLDMVGARLNCRLDNAKVAESEQSDCIAAHPEPAPAE
jgi:hypothetical protein